MDSPVKLLTVVICLLAAANVRADNSELVGHWEREAGEAGKDRLVSLTFTADKRLHSVCSLGDGASIKMYADYQVTADGLVYGVWTSVEAPKAHADIEVAATDLAFSFRYRVNEGSLVILHFKLGPIERSSEFDGRFQAVKPTIAGRSSPKQQQAGQVSADKRLPLLGKWECKPEEGTGLASLDFRDDNRLHMGFAIKGELATMYGEYQVTRDGLVYGVWTSFEAAKEEEEYKKMADDLAFSFRVRVENGSLVIRNFKCGVDVDKPGGTLMGRFHRSEKGKHPL